MFTTPFCRTKNNMATRPDPKDVAKLPPKKLKMKDGKMKKSAKQVNLMNKAHPP